jgi:hypothetical protein
MSIESELIARFSEHETINPVLLIYRFASEKALHL